MSKTTTGLYALGSNGSGQLGIGHRDDVSTPTKVSLPCEADLGPPTKIAAGGNHTMVIYSTGAVFASGENADLRCGVRTEMGCSITFRRVHIRTDEGPIYLFKLCSATWEASTLVTFDNQVYTMGTGRNGELGQGYNVVHETQPKRIAGFPPPGLAITDLTSCVSHTVAVLSNGDVYGWGAGRKGQIGDASAAVWQPRLISNPGFRVMRAVCGREFTYLVGNSHEGQHIVLGSDKWTVKSSAAKYALDWKDIGASWGSVFVLLSNGVLCSWGRNDHGQLAPMDLPLVDRIAIGSEHAVVSSKDGQVLAWGWGEHGNCGLRATVAENSKQPPWNVLSNEDESGELIAVGAGSATSWIWVQSATEYGQSNHL
ncbi:MAG: hypothetical protein M1812_003314 [Candelaria pacifica]|nr:MAG: hypothetical protein M1812_003314 [Candelaria pacifica]